MIEARGAARRLGRTFQVTLQASAVAAALLAFAPAAHAQGLFTFFGGGPSASDIERRLEAAGYSLTGPLLRRGDVYLADVVFMGRRDAQRLVIDADTGRIVQRYRVQQARWRDVPRQWDSDEDDIDGPGPRPPADLDRPAPREQASRDDNPALGTGAPRTTSSDLIETPDKPKPKPRPHEVKSKTAPLAKTSPSMPQNDASVGPAATAPPVAVPPPPAVTPAPPAHATKTEAAPSPAPPSPPPPSATFTAKTEPQPAPKSPPAAEAPDPKPTSKSKAVNDLPVTPLD